MPTRSLAKIFFQILVEKCVSLCADVTYSIDLITKTTSSRFDDAEHHRQPPRRARIAHRQCMRGSEGFAGHAGCTADLDPDSRCMRIEGAELDSVLDAARSGLEPSSCSSVRERS